MALFHECMLDLTSEPVVGFGRLRKTARQEDWDEQCASFDLVTDDLAEVSAWDAGDVKEHVIAVPVEIIVHATSEVETQCTAIADEDLLLVTRHGCSGRS